MIAFLDTNVLLDVFLERPPHAADAIMLFGLVEKGRFRGAVSAISFNNSDYMARKLAGRSKSLAMMRRMMALFDVVSLDRSILEQSLDADIHDFEDAIQYFSALRTRADYLVTRNPAHFPKDEIAVVSPEELLAIVDAESQM